MVDQAKLDGKVRYLDLQGVGKMGQKTVWKLSHFVKPTFFQSYFSNLSAPLYITMVDNYLATTVSRNNTLER